MNYLYVLFFSVSAKFTPCENDENDDNGDEIPSNVIITVSLTKSGVLKSQYHTMCLILNTQLST